MWWRFCWIHRKKRRTCNIFVVLPLKKISGDHMNEICTTQKNNTKNSQQSELNSCSLQSRNHRKFLNPRRHLPFVCMTHVWDSQERPGPSGVSPSLSSLLPIPPLPAAWWEAECHPSDTHTTARRLSTSHCSELTAAAMRGINHHKTVFFLLSFHPKTQKRRHKLSLFTLPVKCYWSFM